MTLTPPDFHRLSPKAESTVLVIGGCGGIGRSLVMAGLDNGLNVIVMDLETSIGTTDLPAGVRAIPIDLREEASIDAAFRAFDDLKAAPDHVAFASGYTADLMSVANMDTEILDDVMKGNIRGQVLAARACIHRMDAGSFVFVSTAIGQVGAPGYGPYAISKAGMNALIRTLAAELAPAIRVNAIAPGPVDTPFIRGGLGRGITQTPDKTADKATRFDKDAFIARTPLGRLGHADDMAGPLLFLMSNAARFITGQVLHVNGGSFMRD